eukprot:5154404-Amphidinium_carterae.2
MELRIPGYNMTSRAARNWRHNCGKSPTSFKVRQLKPLKLRWAQQGITPLFDEVVMQEQITDRTNLAAFRNEL